MRASEDVATPSLDCERDALLIRHRLELAGIEPSPLINEQKMRRSRRIDLNRKYKRKRRSSGDERSA